MITALRLSLCFITLILSLPAARAQDAAPPAAANSTASAAAAIATPYFTDPSVSPDRVEIAFVSGGDIWTVPASGGEARLLISHPASEARPIYSPDGRRLAFVSTRTGAGDIYILDFATGDLRRLTFDDAPDNLDAWSRDGRWIYFYSSRGDIAGMNDIYRVSPEGGTPLPVTADRYTSEYHAAPAPDGRTLLFSARGIAPGQPWRKGHSHLDESEIWTTQISTSQTSTSQAASANAASGYTQQVKRDGKALWGMWDADGSKFYFVSDRSGTENIWVQEKAAQPRQLTRFTSGRVLAPNISADGRLIVFERDFRIWTLDPRNGKSEFVEITRRGASAGAGVERLRLTDNLEELALAPDGKKIAFTVRGEVFAASAIDGGDAARITVSAADERDVAWSPDSRRLVYTSDRDGAAHLYSYDFATNTETRLTNDARSDSNPRFSPDGKWLAFYRDARELRLLPVNARATTDAATATDARRERVLVTAAFERPPINSDRSFVWSPDSRFIAYMPVGESLFTNVFVVAVEEEGGASQSGAPISFLANTGTNTVSWSTDGTFVLFNTGQRTESGQLARVDLVPRTPRFREDQFRDLFREEPPRNIAPDQPRTEPAPTPTPQPTPTASPSPAASPVLSPAASPEEANARNAKRVRVVFDGVRQRLSLLPVGVDVNYQVISPDGKSVVMIASAAGQENLYLYSLDELAREPAVAKQLTSTAGAKSAAQFSPDGKEIFYLDNGRINVVTTDARPPRSVAVTAEMDVDFGREKIEVFRQAWTLLRDHFYDPNYHGANWNRLRADYEPRIQGARTSDEMRRLLSLMIGELNASHLGIGAPPSSATAATTGRTGLRFDREEYEANGRLRVSEVIPLSPAALAGEIKSGAYLLAVDGKIIDKRINLDELLNYKINRRVALTIADSSDGAGRREVVIRPSNAQTEKALLYRKWVEDNRAYVARVSGGRLGYVHMFDMSAASLAQLYVDLDAENHRRAGVVVDLRNNNGGFVNVYAIDVFARRPYLTMTPRGFASAPARTVLGQRSLERPTILVTNQHSLSDAEDFTEGYRALKLGKIVGEPTAGWIIYTWNVRLLDGSTLRLPRMKVTANDGTNMELNPRPVDVPVVRPLGETYAERDTQLDRAVSELLTSIGGGR